MITEDDLMLFRSIWLMASWSRDDAAEHPERYTEHQRRNIEEASVVLGKAAGAIDRLVEELQQRKALN